MPGLDMNGKIALVTGANRGIGKVIAEHLLAHGVGKLYAAVRTPSSAAELVEAHGDRVVPVAFDLGNPATIDSAAQAASDAEIVINNAGVLKTATTFSEDVFEALDFELDMNLKGLIRTARAFAPILKANGGGAFVQLNSVVSIKCFPEFTTYCASKAAAYAVTQALKFQLAEQGTQVHSVHPGPIATDMGDAAGLTEIAVPPSHVAEAIIAALQSGEFHVFPDPMAQQIWGAYEGFARGVVEADMSEG